MDILYMDRIEWHPVANGVIFLANMRSPGQPQFRFGHIFQPEECIAGEDLPLPEALATARLACTMAYRKWYRDYADQD